MEFKKLLNKDFIRLTKRLDVIPKISILEDNDAFYLEITVMNTDLVPKRLKSYGHTVLEAGLYIVEFEENNIEVEVSL